MNLVFLSALLCAALVTTSGRAIDDVMVRVITIIHLHKMFTCSMQDQKNDESNQHQFDATHIQPYQDISTGRQSKRSVSQCNNVYH